jgi:hypothetical protein
MTGLAPRPPRKSPPLRRPAAGRSSVAVPPPARLSRHRDPLCRVACPHHPPAAPPAGGARGRGRSRQEARPGRAASAPEVGEAGARGRRAGRGGRCGAGAVVGQGGADLGGGGAPRGPPRLRAAMVGQGRGLRVQSGHDKRAQVPVKAAGGGGRRGHLLRLVRQVALEAGGVAESACGDTYRIRAAQGAGVHGAYGGGGDYRFTPVEFSSFHWSISSVQRCATMAAYGDLRHHSMFHSNR